MFFVGIDPASGRGTSNIAISLWHAEKYYVRLIFTKQFYLEGEDHPDIQNINTVSYILREFFNTLVSFGLYESFIRTTRKICVEDVPAMIFKDKKMIMTKEFLRLHQVRSMLIYSFIAHNTSYWAKNQCEQEYVQIIPVSPREWQNMYKSIAAIGCDYQYLKSDINDAILIALAQIIKDGLVPDPKHLHTFSTLKTLQIDYARLFAYRRELLFPKDNRYEPSFKIAVAEDIKKFLGINISPSEIHLQKTGAYGVPKKRKKKLPKK